jgi:uncharacterized protein
MEPEPSHSDQIELFSSSEGLHAIKSPVRVKILSMLREKELKFDEIVALSGKAKSTVSAHLKRMVSEGIIDSKPDPEDARKKIFYMKSEYLGVLSRDKVLKEDLEDYVSRYIQSDGNPFEFFRLIFQTIRISLINQGISIDPVLHEAGIKVGETLYPQVAHSHMDQFIQNIARFWENHQLGRVEIQSIKPLIINVSDCFECKGLPYLGKTACAFDSGILEALFSAHYQDQRLVTETKCYATGDEYCSFVVDKKE